MTHKPTYYQSAGAASPSNVTRQAPAGGPPPLATQVFATAPGERVPDAPLERPRDPEWYRRAVFYEVLVHGSRMPAVMAPGTSRGLTSA